VSPLCRLIATLSCLAIPQPTTGNLFAQSAEQSPVQRALTRADRYGDPLPAGALARLGTVRFRHIGNPAPALAFSRDGKTLASGGSVRIQTWEVRTGKPLETFQNHRKPEELRGNIPGGISVGALLFARGNKLLAFGHHGIHAVLYEAATAKRMLRLPEERLEPRALSVDGKLAATVNANFIGMAVWDTATGKKICQFGTENFMTFVIAFSPDGKMLASSDSDTVSNVVRLWDLPTGKELRRFAVQKRTAYGLAFAPDGKALIVSYGTPITFSDSLEVDLRDFTTVLLDVATGRKLRQLGRPGIGLQSFAFSPTGNLLAASDGLMIYLLDVASGKEFIRPTGHEGVVYDLAYDSKGKTLVSAGRDDRFRFWDPATGKPLGELDLPKQMRQAAFSSDGKLLAFSNHDDVPCLWDINAGKEIRKFASAQGGTETSLSPDAKVLVALGRYNDGTLRLWQTDTGRELQGLADNQVWAVAINATGDMLAIAYSENIRLRDLVTGKELWTVPTHTKEGVTGLSFSPDGKTLASGHSDQTIRLWEASSGKCRGWVVKHPDETENGRPSPVSGKAPFAFSPDGKTLASGGFDNTVRLWDLATAKELRCFTGHQACIRAVRFSPDGKTLATASGDSTILVWDLAGSQ
jgi:WD40 repeat protein